MVAVKGLCRNHLTTSPNNSIILTKYMFGQALIIFLAKKLYVNKQDHFVAGCFSYINSISPEINMYK